ncbi:hypothetical protein P7K49_005531 [Saguinus oedipus]|uniref:Uncharacterized protein n=1 Tax=Saguinus oedipus TaxID=9490 RepID=A0ABQ9W0L6_SAGOE|nr:hypothetical protein P7K49_005531 [Saguinus oedipus]
MFTTVKSPQRLREVTFPSPMIRTQDFALLLGMLDPAEKDEKGMPVTARVVVFVFSPEKLKPSILYPATTGRNFDEILRVVTSLQLTAEERVATPVDRKDGDSVIVLPTTPEEEARNFSQKESSAKSSHLARNASATLPSLKCLGELGAGSQRMPAANHVFLQQVHGNILVSSQPRSSGCYTTG